MNIKKLIKSILSDFGTVTTDKGLISYDGEEDLRAGIPVFGEDGEPLADGDYVTEDGKTIKVADGKVAEILDPEAEVDPNEDMACKPKKKMEDVAPEEPAPAPAEPEYDAKSEIDALKAQIEELRAAIGELASQPAEPPVEEQFEKVTAKADNPYTALGENIRKMRK